MPGWVIEWLPIAPWLVAFAVIAVVLVKLWPLFRKFGHFLDDWLGEPARPGVPARAGAMERLASIEHEVTTNHGSSLKDAVKEGAKNTARQFELVHQRLDELAATDDALREDFDRTLNPWEEK